MPNMRAKNEQSWALYPSLHQDVRRLLLQDMLFFHFHHADDEQHLVEDYDTNIMGRFICHNASCKSKGWSSKRVAITIRMYSDRTYNARVYFQRCRACKKLSKPELDISYAERIAYRIKKWYGVRQLLPPPYSGGNDPKEPHKIELCEGCKAGRCIEKCPQGVSLCRACGLLLVTRDGVEQCPDMECAGINNIGGDTKPWW
ncbi:hypothetical protein Purlil1_5193 [Purpureocillium lilacinum]|uniref:3CxxC-type domain-containing protein n=1 Tax=Purpureocillium lilacinum TaxID=33203 RepID=A0ABR0C2A9_PURLI|nr:hypothetical protein Purlil1_5193 [Purpureocillium lilacinum]